MAASKMTFKPFPILTLFAIAGLSILIWLGNWQWARYRDKLDAGVAPPASSEAPVNLEAEVFGPPGAQAQLAYGLIDGQPVWRRYVPARFTSSGREAVLLLWDVTTGTEPEPLPVAGLGSVRRLSKVRDGRSRRGAFTAADRPDENIWYGFDPAAMLANMGIETQAAVQVVEPMNVLLPNAAGEPRPAVNPYAFETPPDPLPPERHFGYALTWWGLGAALVGVYLAFHAARGRLAFRRSA